MGKDVEEKAGKTDINNLSNRVLKIDRASIFNSKIEDVSEIETSIFYEAYKKAARALGEIVNSSKVFNRVDNIITFIGTKGCGKSTILNSFMNLLKNTNINNNFIRKYTGINTINFEVLKTIDASYMQEKSSIIVVILFEIYKCFKKNVHIENYSWKKELEELFNKIFKQLEGILKDEEENLFIMNASFDIKEEINELIRMYLNCCKKDCLILSIDNINKINNTNEVLEDLQKYFRCEKLIILINLEKEKIPKGKINEEEIGVFSNRIYIRPLDFDNVKITLDNEYLSNISELKGKNIFEQVKNLLVTKFNYCISSISSFEILVGRNIKRFINFIVFINSLGTDHENNRFEIFEYVSMRMNELPLSKELMDILKEILKCSINDLNKYILTSLSKLIIDDKKMSEIGTEVKDIYEFIAKNKFQIRSEKISIGDIVTCIEILNLYKTSDSDIVFIESLKACYSIRLIYEYENDSKNLTKIVGKDYIGDYFMITSNIDRFTKLVEITGKKSAEDLKYFFGFRKDLFLSVFEPCYDYKNYYSRLIYKDVNIFNEDDIYKQKFYRLRFLNILSYSMMNRYKLQEEKYEPLFLLCVINIDYWMNILGSLNKKLDDNFIPENKFIIKTIEYLKGILAENKFINIYENLEKVEDFKEIQIKGIEEDTMICDEDVEFLQNLDSELIKAQYLYTYNM